MGSFKLTEQRVRRMELAGMNSVRDLYKVLDALDLKGSLEIEWDWGKTEKPEKSEKLADELSKGGR
jgi:hypothetical protein